jgi:hypothetical protein
VTRGARFSLIIFVVACKRSAPVATSTTEAGTKSPFAAPVALRDATHDVHIEPNRMLTCARAGGTATTKTCAFELAPFEATIANPNSGAALSHVMDELCAIASAAPAAFDVVYSRVEQGGAAGKHEIYEVRSDGAFTVKDALSVVIRRGTAPVIEVAPLSRLVARPELAALGPAYVDPTPPPSVLETDYDLAISKTTTLKGVFHDKTPPIITAITSEIMRVTMLP